MKTGEFKRKLKELGKKNIAIIGHMGSGKSIFGKIIAKKLQLKHFDLDKKIVDSEKISINEIFEKKGEKYFRNIEKKILFKFIEKENIVLSLGGGTILNNKIRNKLKKHSITIFLQVDLEILEKRLKKSRNRPLLKNVDLRKKIKELDTARRKYYLLADIKINNSIAAVDTFKNFIIKFNNFNEKNYTNKE